MVLATMQSMFFKISLGSHYTLFCLTDLSPIPDNRLSTYWFTQSSQNDEMCAQTSVPELHLDISMEMDSNKMAATYKSI